MFSVIFMTTGINQNKTALLKEAITMAWPAVLESFFVSLAGIIDTFMVSSLGTYAVASVGLTTQPKFIMLAPFFASNIAVSALVARRRGQNNKNNANEILLTALTYVLIMNVILTIVGFIFAPQIIELCGSNIDTHEPAVTYFRVITAGMFFNVVSLCINAAQRGSGNTRIAMTTNITSSIVNVIFNYLLIEGNLGFPRLELFGAAFATVLGTVAAFGMSLHSLFVNHSYVSIPFIVKEKIKPKFSTFKAMYRLAINFFIENIAMRIGFLTTAVLAAKLGTDAFAVHQVGMNFLGLGFSFGDGMQVAAVALIGRSLGEKQLKKAKEYGSVCQQIGLSISLFLAALLFFFGRTIFSFFFNTPSTLDLGVIVSRYIMIIVLFQISQVIFGGCLRAAGDVKYTLFASLISVTLIRSLVTWLLVSVFALGLHGVWIGVLADQLSRFTFLSIRFQQGRWVELQI